MIAWSRSRKFLLISGFILPTLIGLLIFNVYPILFSVYTSFTDRNRVRPLPNCEVILTGALDPVCWPVFEANRPRGRGFYNPQEPLWQNYYDVLGIFFQPESLTALGLVAVCFVPLIGVAIWQRLPVSRSVKIHPSWLWGGALILGVALAGALNVQSQYSTLEESGDFFIVMFRTLVFVILRVTISFVLGLALALILNSQHLPGKTLFRVLLFIPWAASSLAILISLIWQFLFRDQGTINQVLLALGLTGEPLPWLTNGWLAFGVVVFVDVWFSYPFVMIVVLGALQAVPLDTYEAAEIDGASWWQQLTQITLPLIRPAILPAMVLTSITAFQIFGSAFAITGGGPSMGAGNPGMTDFVIIYAYKQIFLTQNFGRASAFAVILFILLFAATMYSLRMTRITKGAYDA
jgi:arabinogalactan oligomer/maltooligosaccharide transport system permease protein